MLFGGDNPCLVWVGVVWGCLVGCFLACGMRATVRLLDDYYAENTRILVRSGEQLARCCGLLVAYAINVLGISRERREAPKGRS